MNKKLRKLSVAIIGIIALLTGQPASAQQRVSANYVPTVYGIVLNSAAWTNAPQYGVYSFMPNQSVIVPTLEHQDTWMRANSGGVWYDGILHYMNSIQGSGETILNMYQSWNTETWTLVDDWRMSPTESNRLAADLTYDPVSKTVFGVFFTDDGSGYEVGTMEFPSDASPVKHTLKRLPIDMVAIAASAEGELYSIGLNGALYKLDKTNGNATLIGNTGVVPEGYRQSATFDFRSGKLYWAAMLGASSSALYEVNTTTGAAKRLGVFANNEEVTGLYIPFGLAADEAPSTAENLAVSFPEGSLKGTFSFTIPTENYAADPLTGDVDYKILIDGNEQKSGTSTAGVEELELTEGNHVFAVVLSNAAGQGLTSKMTAYVGHDTPVAVSNLQLSIDNDNYKATLHWDEPTRGVNNGYIDRDELRYIIKRYPGPVTLETDYEGNVYYDELPETSGLRSYYYTIQSYIGEKQGAVAQTPTVNVGKPFEVPWSEDFSKAETFSQFTVIDVDNDGWTWEYDRSKKRAVSRNNDLYNSNDDNDWLISPPLHLYGDRLYDLEFETSSSWLWVWAQKEELEVGFGDNATAENYEMVVPRRIIQQPEEGMTVKIAVKLRPSKEGTYFVGFHSVTPVANAFTLYIHNIQVMESSLLSSPDSVTNLRLEPAAKGANRATIRFNAPTKDLNGDPLTTLTQIQIVREGDAQEVIATFNNPTPGEELSYQDTKTTNGVNTYLVVPYSGDHKGQASRVSGWVGIDYPTAPRNIKAVLADDGIRITWEAPSEVGVNGGYVDPDDLIYQVADKTGQVLAGATELYDLEFTDKNVKLTGQQASNQYYVLPFSELGAHSSGIGVSNVVVTGDPYELPIHESFANGGASYLWVLTADQDDYGFKTTKQDFSDGDNGALYFQGSEYFSSVSADFGSGKLSMKGTENPRWVFDFKPYVGRDVVAVCQVQTADFEIHDVLTIDFKTLTGSNDWRTQVIDLSEFKDQPWIRVIVRVTIRGYHQFTIDNITVEDVRGTDLAASLYVPKTMRIGTAKDVKVTVRNDGAKTQADYTVRLLANGKQVAEQAGVSVEPKDSVTIDFPFSAPVNSPAKLRFQAIVDLPGDDTPANNTTDELATAILQPTLPGVRDLQGQSADGNVTLTWQAPDYASRKQVTDDFEDYSVWLINGFGQWQVIDQDNGRTYNLADCGYPHQTMQTAFMIFNNNETSGTKYGAMNAHSGEQVAASFDAIPSYTSLRKTTDWLISPQLSGEAQTIKFFARSVTESYLETMEVMYTTGTNATARTAYKQASKVDGVPNAWTEYSVDLPEGAQYFAIKNISTDKMALIIDDVTYEPLPLVLTGYDIYVDGERQATLPADALQWTAAGTPDEHGYQVVAVYTAGESALSAVFGVPLGIDAPMMAADLTTADLSVYTVDGILVAQGRGVFQQLRRGVYVVRPAGSTQSFRVVKR